MGRIPNKYIRVTEVTSFINAEWYKYWAKSVGIEECERVSKESTDFGKAVHKVAENYLIGTEVPPTLSNRERFCGDLIVKWIKETNVKPLMINNAPAVECTLTSEKYGYRGHPDLLCTFGEDLTVFVIDWKTSKECRLEYLLQMSAYANALYEEHGIQCNDGAVIRVPSDPNAIPQFQAHLINNLSIYFEVFKEGLNIVKFFKKRGTWKDILKNV